jgi:hypothetical protein
MWLGSVNSFTVCSALLRDPGGRITRRSPDVRLFATDPIEQLGRMKRGIRHFKRLGAHEKRRSDA